LNQVKKLVVVALVEPPKGGVSIVEGVQTLTFNSYSEFKVNFGVFERNGWRLIEAKEVDFFYDLDQKEEDDQPNVDLDGYFKELMK